MAIQLSTEFIALTFQSIRSSELYVDLSGYPSSSIGTDGNLRSNMLLITADNYQHVYPIVGFEANFNSNARRKEDQYHPHLRDLNNDYLQMNFVNLSISCVGIFCQTSHYFLDIYTGVDIDQPNLNYIITHWSSPSLYAPSIASSVQEINHGQTQSSFALINVFTSFLTRFRLLVTVSQSNSNSRLARFVFFHLWYNEKMKF